jgi:hypothetical protein
MPRLLRFSETAGCGATIELDNKEVVYVSIAATGVLIRKWDITSGFFKSMTSNFFGQKLYNEKNVYRNAKAAEALKRLFPKAAPELPPFKNFALSIFATAIWNCQSAAEVCTIFNNAASKTTELDENKLLDHQVAVAFKRAKNRKINVGTYNVLFSDGKSQETRFVPEEISGWVTKCNADAAKENKAYRVVRVVDEGGKVAWSDE